MQDKELDYYNQKDFWEKTDDIESQRSKEIIGMIPSEVFSLLDVGCGSGQVVNSLDIKKVVGVDISKEALKHVKKEKVLASAENLPFEDNSFDMVISSEVLEHLEGDTFLKSLKEIERVAKKYILITVPNKENLKRSSVFCPSCQKMFHPYRHKKSFDKNVLANIFKDFKVLKFKETGPNQPYIPEFLVKILRRAEKPNPLKTSICPFCGFKGPDDSSASFNIFSLIKSKLRIFFPKKKRWLFAFYVRNSRDI